MLFNYVISETVRKFSSLNTEEFRKPPCTFGMNQQQLKREDYKELEISFKKLKVWPPKKNKTNKKKKEQKKIWQLKFENTTGQKNKDKQKKILRKKNC